MKDGRVGQIVEQIRPLIVMDAQALFLNEGVWRTEVQLQRGGEGDRTKRTVRCNGHIVGFGHRSDLADLPDPPGMTQIGLEDVRSPG